MKRYSFTRGLSLGLRLLFAAALVLGSLLWQAGRVAANASSLSFVVNSTGDGSDFSAADGLCETSTPGECTLRAAIEQTNHSGLSADISFNIPGPGPYTIHPAFHHAASAYDIISQPVVIDGTTQPGFSGTPIIEIDGSGISEADIDGLILIGGNSTVRGLVINRFTGIAIKLSVKGTDVVEGNYLGTDVSGKASLGNEGGVNIEPGADNSIIGGTTAAQRNLISGNSNGNGIFIYSGASGNVVEGNYIGTDVTGTAALGNVDCGVDIDTGASNNIIGGSSASARNVISGNGTCGIGLFASGTQNNVVEGNYVGVDATGAVALPNALSGIVIGTGPSNNTIGGRNVASGNGGAGIDLYGAGTTGNVVRGNYVGTDASGTKALGNQSDGITLDHVSGNIVGGTSAAARNVVSANVGQGIAIWGGSGNTVEGNYVGVKAGGGAALGNHANGLALGAGAAHNTVGGTAAGARNVISGNAGFGIVLVDAGTNGNLVQGNYVGTNALGSAALGNTNGGVAFGAGAANNLIGGTTAAARNVISGNKGAAGVNICCAGAHGNRVQGNYIGTTASGGRLGNLGNGVIVTAGAANNAIGGSARAAGNVIAYNGANGVVVSSAASIGNSILSNLISANAKLGIDLGNNGVTLNDALDGDSGANRLQNFPVISAASRTGTSTSVSGTLASKPGTSFSVQFFSSAVRDPSGYGEGAKFLGTIKVTTNAVGTAKFSVILPVAVPSGYFITATATDPLNNTSEFSRGLAVK